MKKLLAYFILIFALIGGGCDTGEKSGDVQTEGNLVKSSVPRNTNPNPAPADFDDLVAGNSRFAFEFYAQLAANPDNDGANLFFSPFSISEALAMAWAGARGNTESEIADVFHFNPDQAVTHNAFNALDLYLGNLGNGNPDEFRLNIANAIWGQDGYPFLQDFLDTLALNYDAGMHVLDFAADPEAARQTVNEWVENKTEHKIKNLLPEGSVTELTRMILTNAIYFKAEWSSTFDSSSTSEGDFLKLDGSSVQVDFMFQESEFNYVEGQNFKAIELPYKGEQTSMIIIQPDATAFETFEASMDASSVSGIIDSMNIQEVSLSLPKFTFEFEARLTDYLKQMGMHDAFSDAADFSGLDGKKDLVITDILHKAFVAVNEKGTEAAAATGVVFGNSAAGTVMHVDSPFIFLIRDRQHGTVLFLGRVLEP